MARIDHLTPIASLRARRQCHGRDNPTTAKPSHLTDEGQQGPLQRKLLARLQVSLQLQRDTVQFPLPGGRICQVLRKRLQTTLVTP